MYNFPKQVLFKIYDSDEDGFVNFNDLHSIMKLIIGKDLTGEQVTEIVNRTIDDADKDRDGKLSFKEFEAVKSRANLVYQRPMKRI